MKKFLKVFLIFITPIIILLLFVEVYLCQINTSYSEKIKGLEHNAENIEILFLGNSHTAYGIDPKQFDLSAYNAAQVSQSLYFDKRITLKYIQKLLNLKFVVIGLDYHSLYFSSQTQARNIWSYYGYGIEYKNEVPFLSKISKLNGYTNKIALNLFEKDRSGKYDRIKALDVEKGVNLNTTIQNGAFFLDGTDWKSMEEQHCQNRAGYFNALVQQSKEKNEVVSDLKDFINQLRSKNITPIFITVPCYDKYVSKLNQEQLTYNVNYIKRMSNELNIEYWDYVDLKMKNESFYNCDHLNKNGAIAFSKILNNQLKLHFNKEFQSRK